MEIKNLVPVDWNNQRVLLSVQLAEAYKCSPKNISDNFNRVKEQFTEGVHYFKLEGLVLRSFREYSEKIGLVIPPNTPRLYLWTYQGCVRHCKMINTPEAWKMFDLLETTYFNLNAPLVAPAAKSKPAKNPNRVAGQKSPARVYVFKLIDGTVLIVKIGQSKDVDARKVAIERKTKLTVEKIYKTSLLPRNVARVIERASHKFFSPFRLNGEFFSADYDTACRFIDALEEVTTKLPQISYFECAEKLLQIADRLETFSGNKIIEKSLLIKSAKLIADE